MTEPYRYEKEVEDFLRWSPSVRNRDPENGRPVVPGASWMPGRTVNLLVRRRVL